MAYWVETFTNGRYWHEDTSWKFSGKPPLPCQFYWPTCKTATFAILEELKDALGFNFGNFSV